MSELAVRSRLPLALAALVSIVALAAGCGGNGTDATTTETKARPAAKTTEAETETVPPGTEERPATVVEITVVGGRPQGGIVRVTVDRGERVTLRVRSDVADEVHLHGYDVEWAVGPGKVQTVGVDAKVPGRFELELHELGTQIGELTVRP